MPVMTKSYYSVEGEIIAEKTEGQERVDYLRDASGSVVATADQSGQTLSTHAYTPYGAPAGGTGTAPSFSWKGAHGYRGTGRSRSERYVRARHYGQREGRWTSVDPRWPEEQAYGYVRGNPINWVDPSGRQVVVPLLFPNRPQ